MEEDGEEDGVEGFDDAFLAGFFAEASDDVGSEGAAAGEENAEESAGSGEEKRVSTAVVEEVGCDDPISKKRRRQMRNRDSAMKSRERKKMYVKELEIKSRYLESERRRLSYALQCCTAENMALCHRLHAEGPLGAHVAVLESAILFVVAGKISNEKLGFDLGSELVLMRRRCRCMKRRMKFLFSVFASSNLFPSSLVFVT